MQELLKNEMDLDCRALSKEFLKEFLPGEKYYPFIELVKKYRDELELCFRGNNQPSEAVCIYYNNHLVYKIEDNGNITINFNHARYSSNYREYWTLINHTYGFNKSAIQNPRIKITEKKSKSVGIRYYTEIGYISSQYSDMIKANVENIYLKCIRKMLIDSFDITCTTDYFRATANKYSGYKGKLGQTGGKSLWLEKVRQQQLFSKIKYQKNGYFLYDLEFAQKTMIDSEEYDDALSNEPDMLAVYFDGNGKPERFAFVEVKCTKSAYGGKSGMVVHLTKMCEYPKSYLTARLREAMLVMYQYNKLELFNLDREVLEDDYLELVDHKVDNLFILTDVAVKEFEKDNCDKIKDFKNNAKQIEEIDIHIPGCKEIEFWVL